MKDIQIKGSEDYGKLCCFRDDEGNELYGHLSLFMKAISNNPNERDMYFRQEDGKAYRMAWKVDEEDIGMDLFDESMGLDGKGDGKTCYEQKVKLSKDVVEKTSKGIIRVIPYEDSKKGANSGTFTVK